MQENAGGDGDVERFDAGRQRHGDPAPCRFFDRRADPGALVADHERQGRPAGTPGQATIAFAVAEAGAATLTVSDVDGKPVKTIEIDAARGLNVVRWDLLVAGRVGGELRPAGPGDYGVTLTAGGESTKGTLRLTRFVRWTR